MVNKLLLLISGIVCLFYGIRYLFFAKTVSERWAKSGGGKFKIKNWKLTTSGKYTVFEIIVGGIILLIIGILVIYFFFFPGPKIKPTDHF
jgi:hypothetical protein